MWPKVSVSLTKKYFLFIQENFHARKSFWKIYPHKTHESKITHLLIYDAKIDTCGTPKADGILQGYMTPSVIV